MSETESKYYTPDILEFHVGFEYEFRTGFMDGTIKTQKDFDKGRWDKARVKVGDDPYIERALKGRNAGNGLVGIRVKHLDREDIEGEGWEPKGVNNYRMDYEAPGIDYILMPMSKNPHWYAIGKDSGSVSRSLFEGYIPNVSVFRQILKYIGVK